MKILTYIYAAAYAVFVVWVIIDNAKSQEPWWDVTSDAVLLPLGGIGMVLFFLSVESSFISSTWKVVAILIVAGQLLTNVVYRRLILSGKSDLNVERISQWAILAADLTSIILLAPMFAMNFMYAFSL